MCIHWFIQQIFAHGDSLHNYLVAIVVPEPEYLSIWADTIPGLGKGEDDRRGCQITRGQCHDFGLSECGRKKPQVEQVRIYTKNIRRGETHLRSKVIF